MEEYLKLLVLAYFREYGKDYSLYEIKSLLGVTIKRLEDIIDILLKEGNLEYDEYILSLSLSGRIKLSDSDMENYSFESETYCRYSNKEKWPVDRPYPIHNFYNNKWRGSES